MPEEQNKSAQQETETKPVPEVTPQKETVKEAEQIIDNIDKPEQKPADQPEKKEEPAQQEPEKKPEPEFNLKPEDYGNFGLPEDVKIDKDMSQALRDFGIKNKVSKEELNSLVKKYNDISTALIEKHKNDFTEIQKGWEQHNADKYKTEVENVYKDVNSFLASTEQGKGLQKFLTENGIDKNSEVIDFLYSLSKDYMEDKNLRGPGTGDVKEKSDYAILYPEDQN